MLHFSAIVLVGLQASCDEAEILQNAVPSFGFEYVLEESLVIQDEYGDIVDLSVDNRGGIYAADRLLNQIWRYSPSGASASPIGSEGEGPGQFTGLEAISTGRRDSLFAFDARQSRISAFEIDADSTHLAYSRTVPPAFGGSAPDDSDRSELGVGSVSTFIPPSRDSASQQAVALGAGTFIGFAGADVAFLHLLGSYERRLSSNVELVAEGGLITDKDNLFAAIVPALKLGLTSENRPSLFARAGPALLGTTSGVEVLVHVGTGIDLAAPANGLRFEARTYVSPSHVSFDLLEVILSYRFDPGNGTW